MLKVYDSVSHIIQCYECDGVKGGGGLCPGNAPWGERQVNRTLIFHLVSGEPNFYIRSSSYQVNHPHFHLMSSESSSHSRHIMLQLHIPPPRFAGWLWGTILWSSSWGAAHIWQIVISSLSRKPPCVPSSQLSPPPPPPSWSPPSWSPWRPCCSATARWCRTAAGGEEVAPLMEVRWLWDILS